MTNKRGDMKFFVYLILTVVAIILSIGMISDWKLDSVFKLVIPDFMREKPQEDVDYGFGCDVKVAKIFDKYITFCADDSCNEMDEVSNVFYVEGDEIKVDRYRGTDYVVGHVVNGYSINVKSSLIKARGFEGDELYFDLQEDVPRKIFPSYEELLNLNGAFFSDSSRKEICRDKRTDSLQERRKVSIKFIEVDGKSYYFDMDDYLQNGETELYLSNDLDIRVGSLTMIISDNGDSSAGIDEGNSVHYKIFYVMDKVKKFRLNDNFDESVLVEGRDSQWMPLAIPIENAYSETGFDTSGDNFDDVRYRKEGRKIYVQFRDTNWGDIESPWILKDYWEIYGSFGRAPEWALL